MILSVLDFVCWIYFFKISFRSVFGKETITRRFVFVEDFFLDESIQWNHSTCCNNICKCDRFPSLEDDEMKRTLCSFYQCLQKAVQRRVLSIRSSLRCGILFSGGLDSAVLAALMDQFYDKEREIELINVAFEVNGQFETPDRKTSVKALMLVVVIS